MCLAYLTGYAPRLPNGLCAPPTYAPAYTTGYALYQRQVLEENEGGWWFARIGATEGWVPANFLVAATDTPDAAPAAPVAPARRSKSLGKLDATM